VIYLFIFIYCSYSVGYGRYKGCENRRANQTKEILHRAAACPNPSVLSYTKLGRKLCYAPLRDIVVGFAYIGLPGAGRVPGFSPWSSPIPPLSHSIDVRRNFLTPFHSPPPRAPPRPLLPRWSRCDVHPRVDRVCPIQWRLLRSLVCW